MNSDKFTLWVVYSGLTKCHMVLYSEEKVQGSGLGACLSSHIILGFLVPGLPLREDHLNSMAIVVLQEPKILKQWGGGGRFRFESTWACWLP